MAALKLIVGLGNPGPQYEKTRHNVGAVWVRALADRFSIPLNASKFKGDLGRGTVAGRDLRLLVPSTYMNLSGESVGALAGFYKIDTSEILVAYDEMAFEPGVVRLKQGGGDNGHNGIKSVVKSLGNQKGFYRLRIGVGHPGDRARVTAYLTQITMPAKERDLVDEATHLPMPVLEDIVAGQWQKAMNELHKVESHEDIPEGGDQAESQRKHAESARKKETD